MKQKSIQNNLKKSKKIECQRENEKELQGLQQKKKQRIFWHYAEIK